MEKDEALHAFFSRVTPLLPELFAMAHAICGSYDLAEYALQVVLLDVWKGNPQSSVSFREHLKRTLRRIACEEALELRSRTDETTWNGFTAEGGGLSRQITELDVEQQRLLALHYGCGLSISDVGALIGHSPSQTRVLLKQLQQKLFSDLPATNGRSPEQLLRRWTSQQLAAGNIAMPSASTIYRTFSAEAANVRKAGGHIHKLLHAALCALLLLLCALVFWLSAILTQPTVPAAPAAADIISEGQTAVPNMQVFPAISPKI